MRESGVWAEFTFQARLRYLAFKRTVWLVEMMLLLALAVVLIGARVPDNWRNSILAVQTMRVFGEIWNHHHLAHGFNAQDRWTWFPFI
jgi:hypothetical protein